MNPFIITGPIPEKYFCDRKEESAKVLKTVTGGANLCLISGRRIGKSKLINYCFAKPEISEHYYSFYIDLFPTSSLQEFVHLFGQEVFSTLKSRSRKMLDKFVQILKSVGAEFGYDPVNSTPTFTLKIGDIHQPEHTLSEIFECLASADKPCIVAFDEFQQIGNYPEKNIEALLRSHIQHLPNVNFIFVGSKRHTLAQMFQSSARPFYQSAAMMSLLPLKKNVYIPFVVENFRQGGRTIEPEVTATVHDLFEGNTWCMQRLFHDAFLNLPVGGSCTLDFLSKTLDDIMEEAAATYNILLSNIPTRQKELLYAIAADVKAEQITGAEFIRRHSLLSSSSVQAAALKLKKMDLIDSENGIYTINDILLRMHLRRVVNPEEKFL